jgi:hypothetical protein
LTITDTSTNADFFVAFASASSGTTNDLYVDDPGLKFNPFTGTLTANVFTGTANQAKYADLAECYLGDSDYPAGTVVVFGGDQEVTESTKDSDTAVAGVVTTNPAYLMNSGLEGEHVTGVALMGRVPCRVIGNVKKGDLLVSTVNGHAKAAVSPSPGTIIGKSLENFDGDHGIIEVVVGRV